MGEMVPNQARAAVSIPMGTGPVELVVLSARLLVRHHRDDRLATVGRALEA